jgi:hypothetical protein
MNFFVVAVLGVLVFAPSIILIGCALKNGPTYIATTGIWAVGVYAMNTAVGVFAFRVALGMVNACPTVVLLKPA